MNQYGEQKFEKAWSKELALVAKHGWMLAGMCPCDLVAFCASADSLLGSSEVPVLMAPVVAYASCHIVLMVIASDLVA